MRLWLPLKSSIDLIPYFERWWLLPLFLIFAFWFWVVDTFDFSEDALRLCPDPGIPFFLSLLSSPGLILFSETLEDECTFERYVELQYTSLGFVLKVCADWDNYVFGSSVRWKILEVSQMSLREIKERFDNV